MPKKSGGKKAGAATRSGPSPSFDDILSSFAAADLLAVPPSDTSFLCCFISLYRMGIGGGLFEGGSAFVSRVCAPPLEARPSPRTARSAGSVL